MGIVCRFVYCFANDISHYNGSYNIIDSNSNSNNTSNGYKSSKYIN